MNYRQSLLLSVAAVAFAAPALSFAAGVQPGSGEAATAFTFNATPSTVSRAEVRQELKDARMNGTLAPSQEGAISFAPADAGMPKSRAQVRSELSSSMANRSVSSVI